MTPNEKGSFCHVCAKTVVDFTSLSDDEVKNYFLQHKGQKTCGRFNNTQLTQPTQTADTILLQQLPLWKKFLAIVIICFGSFLTGCNEQVQGKISSDADTEHPTIKYKTTIGVMLTPIDTIPSKQEETVCTSTVGDIKVEVVDPGITTGVIALPPAQPEIMEQLLGVPDVEIANPVKDNIAIKEDCNPSQKKDTIYYTP